MTCKLCNGAGLGSCHTTETLSVVEVANNIRKEYDYICDQMYTAVTMLEDAGLLEDYEKRVSTEKDVVKVSCGIVPAVDVLLTLVPDMSTLEIHHVLGCTLDEAAVGVFAFHRTRKET
ncbi:MAG: hypothetical protein KKF08_18915 [Gammaproteobacteria bacterium]|nr:hypothetical protein [Gammaproteobacteria bacterium]